MKRLRTYLPLMYSLILSGFLIFALFTDHIATQLQLESACVYHHCFVIDPGHGGPDGGAISCTGDKESDINLNISLRLNDLMRLMGYQTEMIRTEDISVYTQGQSLGAKKASDLKERVRIVNKREQNILLSIHQNYYADASYYGAQAFYPKTAGSKELAQQLQQAFCSTVNPGSTRQAQEVKGLYLMNHIQRPGVLIECGFLSNYEEANKLKQPDYQKKLCCVIASVCAEYVNNLQIA